jgi:hypothetical protein
MHTTAFSTHKSGAKGAVSVLQLLRKRFRCATCKSLKRRHKTSGIGDSNSRKTTITFGSISLRLSLRHADVVDHNTEEERQTDRGNYPRTTQVLIHMSFAEANQRHQTQSNTRSGGDCKSDYGACAALVLGQ